MHRRRHGRGRPLRAHRLKALDVGIIGCGTAGSAAAIFLARAGHRVTLYERVLEPGPVGAGITIQPTGLHVLHRLGLYDEVVARGARIERLLCETKGGKHLVDLSYRTAGEGLFGLGLHRGALFEALFRAVKNEAIAVTRGVEIVDLARAGRSAWSWLVDADGDRHGPHELVVVADGARSQLRDDTSTSKRIERYPWGAMWFVANDTREGGEERTRLLHQRVDGNHTMLGLLPTGYGPIACGTTDPLVSVFWSMRADGVDAFRRRGLAAWKADVLQLESSAAPVLAQIHDMDQLLFAAYHDVVMHRWSTRNVVYLGDAAHATSPQLGQGCNLALWDAMTLDDALLAEPRDLAVALDRYSRARRDHLAFYQVATRWLTPLFQGDDRALGALRDALMPLFGKLGITRRIMTFAMLGVMDGFFGRTLLLELPGGTRDLRSIALR